MKVLYLYDNFPAYRKDFFALLDSKLHEKKMQFAFYYGSQKENASLQETASTFPVKSFQIVNQECWVLSLSVIRISGKHSKSIILTWLYYSSMSQFLPIGGHIFT